MKDKKIILIFALIFSSIFMVLWGSNHDFTSCKGHVKNCPNSEDCPEHLECEAYEKCAKDKDCAEHPNCEAFEHR